MDARTRRFTTALNVLGASQLHRLSGFLTRGSGLIFTLHHVRPDDGRAFAPNKLLEITPDFLETVFSVLEQARYDVVDLSEAAARLKSGQGGRFAVFTFDDGYRDVRDWAMPVMRRHNAPATLFVTTDFADGTGDLWWLALERAIDQSNILHFRGEAIDTSTTEKKYEAWHTLYWRMRAMPEHQMREEIAILVRQAGVDMAGITSSLCMNWDELRALARDPLVRIGNHTVGHYMLAKHDEPFARAEIAQAQERITAELGFAPPHLAYPVGDPTSASPREFRLARELGFETAVTTRLGVLHPEHRNHLTSLPRISLNGLYQQRKYAELFVSGLPFAINNRFRKLNIG